MAGGDPIPVALGDVAATVRARLSQAPASP
jgi:hypothetical protein